NFYKRIEELEGKVIGEYIGNDININCICKNGHKCSPTPHNIQRGNGMCITCAGKDFKVAKANFYKRIEELEGKVVGEYTGSSSKVECVCKNGHICNPYPNNIQQGQGMCQKCKQSGGEIFISIVLELLRIIYRSEVNNDKLKRKLRFDFYFEYQGKMYYLEFDGIQHFKYIPFFYNNNYEIFIQKQQIDLVKNHIARKNNITMIRIAYPQIKDISVEEFSKYLLDLIENNKDKWLITDHELYNEMNSKQLSEETIKEYIKAVEEMNDEDLENDNDDDYLEVEFEEQDDNE